MTVRAAIFLAAALIAATPALAAGPRMDLKWTPSTDNFGVTLYRVQRCKASTAGTCSASWSVVGTSPVPCFADTSVISGTRYIYRVRAEDAAGNVSSYSRSPYVAVTAPLAPPAVSLPTVSFTWSATRAETCVATGAWSGPRAMSGTVTLNNPVAGDYTLTCTGPSGTTSQTITVNTSVK